MDFHLRQLLLDNDPELVQELVLSGQDAREPPAGITKLGSLTMLTLSFGALRGLQGVEQLQRLRALDVSHNALPSLRGVEHCAGLTKLLAGSNHITSTAPLSGLAGLQFLALHRNRLGAVSVLALSGLRGLRHLTLDHNPLCQQQPQHWQEATIALLPGLQAFGSSVITDAQRAAAAAHTSTWQDCCTCEGAQDAAGSRADQGDTSTPAQAGSLPSRRSSSSSGGGQAGSARTKEAAGTASIKDVHAQLPSLRLPPSKPSSLVRRATLPRQPSRYYGYSRARPLSTLLPDFQVRSDGSASLTWPERSLAISCDPEDAPAAGGGKGAAAAAGALAAIPGYRLLAMHRGATPCVALSCDSSGGFAQYAGGSGALALIVNKLGGAVYGRDGRPAIVFTSKRQPLQEDVTVQLDGHLSVRLLQGTHELQLLYACDGAELAISQRHGPMLAADGDGGAGGSSNSNAAAGVGAGQDLDPPALCTPQLAGAAGGSSIAAATAGLPDVAELSGLMERARALMAAATADAAAPTGPQARAGSPARHQKQQQQQQQQQQPLAEDEEDSGQSQAAAEREDLQAMLECARAAVAAVDGCL